MYATAWAQLLTAPFITRPHAFTSTSQALSATVRPLPITRGSSSCHAPPRALPSGAMPLSVHCPADLLRSSLPPSSSPAAGVGGAVCAHPGVDVHLCQLRHVGRHQLLGLKGAPVQAREPGVCLHLF
mmetsp:Transcript_2537/g.5657  ORF Transcript_2537/g.5657 Transcript_2537/m.5657 type:complete len:127 (+) Transcript_2537:1653-2033(+)